MRSKNTFTPATFFFLNLILTLSVILICLINLFSLKSELEKRKVLGAETNEPQGQMYTLDERENEIRQALEKTDSEKLRESLKDLQ